MANTRKGRKLVYVSEDVLNELIQQASKMGVAPQALMDHALKTFIKMVKAGVDPAELETYVDVARTQRASGMTLVPVDVIRFLEGKADPRQLESKWQENGAWYGKYIKGKVANPVKFLGELLKATRWDLDEVEVEDQGENVKFKCVSTAISTEGTACLRSFIEGAMHSLGYAKESQEEMKGIIILKFKKLQKS